MKYKKGKKAEVMPLNTYSNILILFTELFPFTSHNSPKLIRFITDIVLFR